MAMDSIFYTILAVLGLGFLVFIHELGHYWMAKRVGMRVETFSIGFGRPIFSWMHEGTKWQIGWLPFGGYVKIAGTETDQQVDLYSIPDGFYGQGPWNRIKVAFMGPLVNIVFAFVAFGLLWSLGGREKSFSQVTAKIGWVDPQSELYAQGVRPGDEITAYDDHPFEGAMDHGYAIILADREVKVKGAKENYQTNEKSSFEYIIEPYFNPLATGKIKTTLGILSPAHYFIYNRLPNNEENPLLEKSPMANSGIEYGDRLLWVDGELIFSNSQLEHVLNDGRVLLTVERNGKTFLARVPRVPVSELRLDLAFREELSDWQYEAKLNDRKVQALYALPYNLTNHAVIENELKFIDNENREEAFPRYPFSDLEKPLLPGDHILAIDGIPIQESYELLSHLQTRHVNIIVQRNSSVIQKVPAKSSDLDFDRHIDYENIQRIANTIGTPQVTSRAGDLVLLKPVVPLATKEFLPSAENRAALAAESKERQKEIEAVNDPNRRAQLLANWKPYEERLLLGIPYQDKKVNYNPSAIELLSHEFKNMARVLQGVFEKPSAGGWLSGPVGIIKVVHDSWSISYKEALFWLGLISLNLGVLNLLPIPVLDGGTIFLSLFELVTRRRIPPKTLERLIVPFAILLIAFFVYVTFNDIHNFFTK